MGLMASGWHWILIAIGVVSTFFAGIGEEIPLVPETTLETFSMGCGIVAMTVVPGVASRRQVA